MEKPNINVAVISTSNKQPSQYKNVTLKASLPFSSQVIKTNTIYAIKHDFDLNGNIITIPNNCVLKFEGGSIKNGTIIGLNTVINAPIIKIFGENTFINGTWNITEVYPEWWGAKGDGITNSTTAFQKAVDFVKNSGTVKIPIGEYLIDTIIFDNCQGVNFEGSGREGTILRMNNPLPVIRFSQTGMCEKCNIGNFSIKPSNIGTIDDINNVAIYYTRVRQCRLHDIGFMLNNWGLLYAFTYVYGDFVYRNTIERFYITALDSDALNRGGIKYCIKTKAGNVANVVASLTVRDSQFYGITNGEAAIDMSGCNGFDVSDCLIESNGNYALILGSRGLVQGNWFESQNIAPLLFQNDLGFVVSAFNTFIGNVFQSPNPMVVPQNCSNNSIVYGNTFFNNLIVKYDNTINVEGLQTELPSLNVLYKPDEINISSQPQFTKRKNNVWHIEYYINGNLDYNLVFFVNTESTANIKYINVSAQDIWGSSNNAMASCTANTDGRITLEYRRVPVMLSVDVEFC